MSDQVAQFTVAAGGSYPEQAQSDMVKFDIHNLSPFRLSIMWGQETTAIAVFIPPMCSALGYGPDPKFIASNRWTGWIVVKPLVPLGGSSPPINIPWQEITIIGYRQGEAISAPILVPLQGLTTVGGGSLTAATSLDNEGNGYGTEFIKATAQPPVGWSDGPFQTVHTDNSGDFWITSRASSSTLTEKNFEVVPGTNITHGQVLLDAGKAKSDGTGGLQVSKTNLLQTGNQETGKCGGAGLTNAIGQAIAFVANFKQQMTNVPSSITFSGLNTTNANAPSAGLIDVYGFEIFWTSVAAGITQQIGNYTTVGN